MIAQERETIKPPPASSAQSYGSQCACGHCRRYWLAKPDGELTVYDNEDGIEVTAWLPPGWSLRRLAAGEQAQGVEFVAANGATVRFTNGQLYLADLWHDLTVWLLEDVALVFDESAAQAESEADRG